MKKGYNNNNNNKHYHYYLHNYIHHSTFLNLI